MMNKGLRRTAQWALGIVSTGVIVTLTILGGVYSSHDIIIAIPGWLVGIFAGILALLLSVAVIMRLVVGPIRGLIELKELRSGFGHLLIEKWRFLLIPSFIATILAGWLFGIVWAIPVGTITYIGIFFFVLYVPFFYGMAQAYASAGFVANVYKRAGVDLFPESDEQ